MHEHSKRGFDYCLRSDDPQQYNPLESKLQCGHTANLWELVPATFQQYCDNITTHTTVFTSNTIKDDSAVAPLYNIYTKSIVSKNMLLVATSSILK